MGSTCCKTLCNGKQSSKNGDVRAQPYNQSLRVQTATVAEYQISTIQAAVMTQGKDYIICALFRRRFAITKNCDDFTRVD